MTDVLVLGGGPAGSTCAGLLAKKGRSVVVLERERFPRFHLGESLLPQSMPVLEALGVLEDARARFQIKRGAQFHDEQGRVVRYDFGEAFDARFDHAMQVPRDEFDELLLRRAQTLGADVREGWTATRVLFDGARACGVEAHDPAGEARTIDARFVVDATGRDAMLARPQGGTEREPGLENTAFYTQYTGAWRDAGERRGDIVIALVPAEPAAPPPDASSLSGWFWFIPFKDGRTSVGAVMKHGWTRAARDAGARTPAELFARALAASTAIQRLVEGASQVLAPAAVADFTFRARALAGDGWLAVGDAGGFIDPLFSTGAHVAMTCAQIAAGAIDAALAAGDVSRARFDEYVRATRHGTETFIGAVQAFYEGDLVTYLFATPQRPVLRRSITSLLAGDVFGDARWKSELRARFGARLA
jgi:flavin-dependent dehydrogenase